MNSRLLIAGLFLTLIVQGCSNSLATKDADGTLDKTLATRGANKSELREPPQPSTPEMQIIREMYQSGCLITQLELNRRQQNLRISCAHEQSSDSSTTDTI